MDALLLQCQERYTHCTCEAYPDNDDRPRIIIDKQIEEYYSGVSIWLEFWAEHCRLTAVISIDNHRDRIKHDYYDLDDPNSIDKLLSDLDEHLCNSTANSSRPLFNV